MKDQKRFILRKYVMASNAREALRKDKTSEVDDVWVDDDWKKLHDQANKDVGFCRDEKHRSV